VSCRDAPEAIDIARHALSHRLCASANVLHPVHSLYLWPPDETIVEERAEAILVLPTLESQVPDLERTVAERHSYGSACMLAAPMSFAHESFVRWLQGEIGR
jgi:uncharacterized protein involved in tolerance to divalent cations